MRSREEAGAPRPLKKGNNGTAVVERLPFPGNFPVALEEAMPAMNSASANELAESAFKKIRELKASARDLGEIEDGMNALLYDLACREEVNYSLVVDKLLMRHWTQKADDGSISYNAHMQDHVDAADTLFEGVMKELRNRFRGNRKIRILDVSCGTGEVLKKFLDRVPRDVLHRIQVVANDASPAALEVCRETLKGYEGRVKKIRYSNLDVSKELPDGKFHIILESQSMEFISDDRIIKAKRLGRTIRQDEEEYDRMAKRDLASALFDRLVPERGLMLMVQEDPMMLTQAARDADGLITKMLFDEIFRPISKEHMITDVLKEIPGVKFICDLQAPIDRRHDMYLIASSRSRKKDAKLGYHSMRPSQLPPSSDRTSRDFDVNERNIVQAMETIYPILAERLRKINGDNGVLRPISGTRLVIDRQKWDDEASKPHFWRRNGTNDLVIISGLIHYIGIERYQSLIYNLSSSGKVKEGTVLLFIDEWPAPPGLVDDHVGNSDARKFVYNMKGQAQTFLASYRNGNKIGYLHVKRDPLRLYSDSEEAEAVNDTTSPQPQQTED